MKWIKRINEADEDEDDINDDVIENLLTILRKFIRNAGFEPYVSYDDDDHVIVIQFILDDIMNMASLMKVMKLLSKLKSDILIQYDCEFDLAQTTNDSPLITTSFYYSDSPKKQRKKRSDDEKAPFDVDQPKGTTKDEDELDKWMKNFPF